MMECYSAIKKKNEIMPFAATWMDFEMFIRNEVSQRKTNIKHHLMWNLGRGDTNELIYKIETDPQP